MTRTRPITASVIIPAYNAATTIARALDSAAAAIETCRATIPAEIEIVVVDDQSNDTTADVVTAWRGSAPVRLLRNAANRGAGASRNAGVKQAKGDTLFFLDADDVFYPNHIRVCLEALLADDTLGYVFTRVKVDMPMHEDWRASLDESCPINFALHRVWHDMIQGFPEENDFRTYGAEDTLYRLCMRNLVRHKKVAVETCQQFVSPGNALDRQRKKFSMSMAEWNRAGLDDGFVMTPLMESIVKGRLEHIAKLMGR